MFRLHMSIQKYSNFCEFLNQKKQKNITLKKIKSRFPIYNFDLLVILPNTTNVGGVTVNATQPAQTVGPPITRRSVATQTHSLCVSDIRTVIRTTSSEDPDFGNLSRQLDAIIGIVFNYLFCQSV